MKNSTIYSIGHGNKDILEFVNELKSFNIEYLFDVRSKPYSRFNPFFNQKTLDFELEQHSITYAFIGEYLGGLPSDVSCYVDGKVDYTKISEKDFFKEGIKLLLQANAEGLKVAVMCSESKPENCHRSKLIGQELIKHNISIKHIITSNNYKEQLEVIAEVTKGKNLSNLFGEKTDLTSRKNY